jgi:hypothetical protein
MATSALLTLLVGLVLGLKHSTEADHLAAVSTLVTDTHGVRRGAMVGAFWGLGHLLTLFVLGAILIIFRLPMTPRIAWGLEFLVALVLIGLGARAITLTLRGKYHFHVHEHAGHEHAHLHFHTVAEKAVAEAHSHTAVHAEEPHDHLPARGHGIRPLLVGMAHGLAGTASLTLLVLTTIQSRALGIVYLLVFGSGAMLGMAGFGAVLGAPLGKAAERLGWLRALRLTAGTFSFCLGVFLAIHAFLPSEYPF